MGQAVVLPGGRLGESGSWRRAGVERIQRGAGGREEPLHRPRKTRADLERPAGRQFLEERIFAGGKLAKIGNGLKGDIGLAQGEEDGVLAFLGQDLGVLAVAVEDARGAHGKRRPPGLV